MKNVHVLPTDKPSRLFIHNAFNDLRLDTKNVLHDNNQNLYITSDEEIKEGVDQWYLDKFLNKPRNSSGSQYAEKQDVIILTTDQDLIKDGVQAIDDTFLEWFVKNPSCEEVEVGYGWIRLTETDNEGYWVSIPNKQFEMQQEEPKQETLEEAAEEFYSEQSKAYEDEIEPMFDTSRYLVAGFIDGAKWQQERMYIEADKIMKFLDTEVELKLSDIKTIERIKWYFETYFEQFKKK